MNRRCIASRDSTIRQKPKILAYASGGGFGVITSLRAVSAAMRCSLLPNVDSCPAYVRGSEGDGHIGVGVVNDPKSKFGMVSNGKLAFSNVGCVTISYPKSVLVAAD